MSDDAFQKAALSIERLVIQQGELFEAKLCNVHQRCDAIEKTCEQTSGNVRQLNDHIMKLATKEDVINVTGTDNRQSADNGGSNSNNSSTIILYASIGSVVGVIACMVVLIIALLGGSIKATDGEKTIEVKSEQVK